MPSMTWHPAGPKDIGRSPPPLVQAAIVQSPSASSSKKPTACWTSDQMRGLCSATVKHHYVSDLTQSKGKPLTHPHAYTPRSTYFIFSLHC